jgi:hypothetical protein
MTKSTNKTSSDITNDKTEVLPEKENDKEFEMVKFKLMPAIQNAITVKNFSKENLDDIDLGQAMAVLQEKVIQVKSGNLSILEATLTAQTVALDTIFNALAKRSATNLGEYLPAAETYMRLALKAQAQCTKTIEVLAAIKNPPVVYAKQVNMANGNQQVNNESNQSNTLAHADKMKNQQNELLTEAKNSALLYPAKMKSK